MSAPSTPDALPLRAAVAELGPSQDGRTRVTFKRFAGVYFVAEDVMGRDELLAVLDASRTTGMVLSVRYRFADKCIVSAS